MRRWQPLAQQAQRLGAGHTTHLGDVLFLNIVARVHHAVGQFAVVGQQQQSLGRRIEPADREQSLAPAHQRHDRRAAERIVTGRCHIVTRFVQRQIDQLGHILNQAAIDGDARRRRVDAVAHLGHDLPVDGNMAAADQILAGPARGDPGAGQELVQALFGHSYHPGAGRIVWPSGAITRGREAIRRSNIITSSAPPGV